MEPIQIRIGEDMIDFNGLKVLIVEDQAEARAMLRNMLSELGVNQVFEAPDGSDAINFMEAAFDYVDVILCDWNMPELSGIDFLKKLRESDPDVPFLMITGRGDMASVVDAKNTGVSGYIRKPFSPAQLEAKLRILMQRAEAA